MTEREHPHDPNTASYWLERFFKAHPGGGLDDFDGWAGQQEALAANPGLLGDTRKSLVQWLAAAELLAGEEVQEGLSAFRRRDKRADGHQASLVPEALQPGRRIGQFKLARFIAKGGMGQVWEAEDTELRRRVALKLVLPDRIDERSLALFAREARAGGRVQHPNLVMTYGYGTDDGLTWIAQELVEGSWTLKDSLDALRADDSVPKGYYREVAELVAKIADGMQAVHDAGVIHRDLKPQNILIAGDDTPKVTDFGLARVTDDSFFSQTGDFAGTWAYMSPEQVTAKRMGLDDRTDVFSLGVVLYELLTLRRPFEGDTTHQIAQEIIYSDPPDPSKVKSQCPRELAVICGKALEKVAGRRYQSMREFGADLCRHLGNEPIVASPPGLLTRAVKVMRRHPTIASTALVGSLAVVALLAQASQVWIQARNAADRAEDLALLVGSPLVDSSENGPARLQEAVNRLTKRILAGQASQIDHTVLASSLCYLEADGPGIRCRRNKQLFAPPLAGLQIGVIVWPELGYRGSQWIPLKSTTVFLNLGPTGRKVQTGWIPEDSRIGSMSGSYTLQGSIHAQIVAVPSDISTTLKSVDGVDLQILDGMGAEFLGDSFQLARQPIALVMDPSDR